MWKGRDLVYCVVAFMAGNFLGDALTLPPFFYLLSALVLALFNCQIMSRGKACALMLLADFVMLGAAGIQIGRMPPVAGTAQVLESAAVLKERFSSFLENILPPGDELSVFKAIAIGDKSDLTRDLRVSYRESGAMHLLALSGLHVGIIYGMMAWLLRPLGGHRTARFIRSVLTLAALWVYALVSGMSPSISRAVLMITFFEATGLVSGERDGPAALAASALVITLVNPEAPRQISFQLSYSAVVSIYTVCPLIERMLTTNSRVLKLIWKSLCISISCQMTCGVIGFIYFGSFPKYFLITNLLAVPVATVSMYSAVAAIVAFPLPTLGHLAAALLKTFLSLLNGILRLIASLP